MARHIGVLATADLPDSPSVDDQLTAAEQAWRVQPRQAGARRAANGRSAALTPEQIASLMAERTETLGGVLGARMEIANLLKERQQGFRSPASIMTEIKAKEYYDSASDGTLQAVDAHLRTLEGRLRDPRGSYRTLSPVELGEQAKRAAKGERPFAAVYSADLPNTVGVNYPVYSRVPKNERLVTQAHEWLHPDGFSLGVGEELYGYEAMDEAKKPGGTAWALHKNAENTAMFALRPLSGVLRPLPVLRTTDR